MGKYHRKARWHGHSPHAPPAQAPTRSGRKRTPPHSPIKITYADGSCRTVSANFFKKGNRK